MQSSSILTITATIALVMLLVLMPVAQAEVYTYQHTSAAQFAAGGSILNQFDSMLNNLTKRFDINPLVPATPQSSPKAATPSVKISDVKASSSGQSNTKPQVTVTLQNGKTAVSGVRVSAYYSTTAGSTASSDSTVVSLSAGETRALQFSPSGLTPGNYEVSVAAFKDGTDPSNKATPPYDMRENAATLSIVPTPSAAPTEKATDTQDQPNAFGDVLSQVNTWIIFIVAISALITIALFFVFSQNRSGDDRFEEDHFNDEYPPGGGDDSKIAATRPSPPPTERTPTGPTDTTDRPRRRQIAIEAAESDQYTQKRSYDTAQPSSTNQSFDSDGFVVGDVSSRKALRNKIRGKKGV